MIFAFLQYSQQNKILLLNFWNSTVGINFNIDIV